MIRENNGLFILDTDNTTYMFKTMETGQLEHLYYGRKVRVDDTADNFIEKHAFAPGTTNVYDREHKEYTLEDVCLEMSGLGKGDYREPLVEMIHADGSRTCDFTYEGFEIFKGYDEMETLPTAYDESGEVDHLTVKMKDRSYDIVLELHYYIFEKCDIITRRSVLKNVSGETVRLTRLMSMMMDMDHDNYTMTTFNGAWAREMRRFDIPVRAGKHVSSSNTGTSSHYANPFFAVSRTGSNENVGDVFGFNLIYSGNHMEVCEASPFGKLRVVSGINPEGFDYVIEPEGVFESPEAVMTFSSEGFNGMSQNMHAFVREHIVRGNWKKKVRPILLNSWEAAYFNINEKKLLKLAKAAAETGIELFVMDDGWFGKRDNDETSLGDWDYNPEKLPGGIKGICDKIKALGLDFGIWVEPEMVNVDSNLYREHSDWVLEIPDKPHSEGRNQRILDLGNKEVQDFIIKKMTEVFSSADISYVKWDMNRTMTDVYSKALPPERQGEVAHRYVIGLYRVLSELMSAFPDILFEGCASGGNRFDLGMLSFFPQIWASDDTDAVVRAEIQTGYSYGYPMSVVSAHVSGVPNHQTLRVTPLETRFAVASFGVLGYECNLADLGAEEMKAIKTEIELYKNWRETFFFGNFYRGRSFTGAERTFGLPASGSVLSGGEDNVCEWTVVSQDGKKAACLIMQKMVMPNTQYQYYKPCGLNPDAKYHFYGRELKYNIKDFGDLVNTVSPIHIKQDSMMHNMIAHFVKMDGETEDFTAYGDAMMYGGVKLAPAFGGTGYNEKVRFYPDFGARVYFMEAEE